MLRYLLIFFIFNFVQTAFAHSPLTFVMPEDGAILVRPPQKIEMSFKAPVKLIKIKIYKLTPNVSNSFARSLFSNSEKVEISLDEPSQIKISDRHITNLPLLDYGTYKTNWRALGSDGHVMKGSFSFKILGK